MVVNRQGGVSIDASAVRAFVRRLKTVLRLDGCGFDVALVDDAEIARLNRTFRSMPSPTDVLSFPWNGELNPKSETAKAKLEIGNSGSGARNGRHAKGGRTPHPTSSFQNVIPDSEFPTRFLGDIVISAETAKRNALEEGHSTANEIRWLILHGILHLLGYDHEKDSGEMTAMELDLRSRLGIEGGRPRSPRRKRAQVRRTGRRA